MLANKYKSPLLTPEGAEAVESKPLAVKHKPHRSNINRIGQKVNR